MKKTIMFLGVLSLGLAHAQYEGKIGVNTETPGATLDIKAFKSDNATTKRIIGTAISYDPTKIETGIKEMYGLKIANIDKAIDLLNGYTKNYAIYTEKGRIRLGDNVMIKTDAEAPNSSLTVNGISAVGNNTKTENRSLFSGLAGGKIPKGIFTGFGIYPDNSNGMFIAAADNGSDVKYRFLIYNQSDRGRVLFTPFIMTDGTTTQDFNSETESALTIVHEGKKMGIGTISPTNKLHIKADTDPLKLEGLQTATGTNTQNLVVENGVVKLGTGATRLGGENNIECNEANRGKMNFIKDITMTDGQKADAFGICLKGTNGYTWRYLYGNEGVANQGGNFGTNLNP